MSAPHRIGIGMGVLCLLLAGAATAEEPRRLLLLGSGPDGHPAATHEYMPGLRVLERCLADVPNLEITLANVEEFSSDDWLALPRYDGVVLFLTEGAKWLHENPRPRDALTRLAAEGGGLAALHWAIGTKPAEPIDGFLRLLGACHGGPDRRYQVVEAPVYVASPGHEVTRGISDFRVRDEFYYQLKRVDDEQHAIEPLLRVPLEGRDEMVSWAWQRPDGGRSFGFSGLHFHDNWRHEPYRRLMAQGVLWTLKLPIPAEGLAVDVSDDDLLLPAPASR